MLQVFIKFLNQLSHLLRFRENVKVGVSILLRSHVLILFLNFLDLSNKTYI